MERPARTEAIGGIDPAAASATAEDARAAAVSCARPDVAYWPRGLLSDIGTCLVVALVLTAIVVPFWGIRPRIILLALVVNSIVSLGIGMTVCSLYHWVGPIVERRAPGRIGRVLMHASFIAVSVLAGGELALRVLALIGFQIGPMRAGVFQIGAVVVVIVTGFAIAFEKLRDRAREVELREQQARQQALRARLEALQARTDPHFLFNTLNTVAGLIEEDPATAERMLERLSGVFRYALAGSKSQWVRLEDELEAVRNYLEVEAIRFGDRLTTSFEIQPNVGVFLTPPLLLQPLVENALLHGVAPRPEGGRITVRASRSDAELVLTVEDDGPGPGASPHRGSGTGLDNLRDRLRLTYADRARLESERCEPRGYRATLRLPIDFEAGS